MNNHLITITPEGKVDPVMVTLSAGDTVRFQNDAGALAVLKFRKKSLFGEFVYRIEGGTALPLHIHRKASSDTYFYEAKLESDTKPKPGSPCIILD